MTVLIVIDDFHVTHKDERIASFFAQIVQSTRGGPRWLLSSRSQLQLPNAAKWLVYGDLDVSVDACDLQLTDSEAAEIARGRGITDHTAIEHLLEAVDGWPAGFCFALRREAPTRDIGRADHRSRDALFRFLATEVWADLNDDERSLLRYAAHLPELGPPSLASPKLAEIEKGLQQLRLRVPFISRTVAGTPRLHDLFREFVKDITPCEADQQGLLRECARMLRSSGQYVDALDRFIAVNAVDDIAAMLHERFCAGDLFGAALGLDLVQRALNALRENHQAPLTLAIHATYRAAIGDGMLAGALYRRAYERATDARSRVFIGSSFVTFLNANGDFRESGKLLEGLCDDGSWDDAARLEYYSVFAQQLALPHAANDLPRAARLLEQAIKCLPQAGPGLRVRYVVRCAVTAFFSGNLASARRLADESGAEARRTGLLRMAVYAQGVSHSVYVAQGNVPRAALAAERMYADAVACGDSFMIFDAHTRRIFCAAELGDVERLEALVGEMAHRDRSFEPGYDVVVAARVKAALIQRQFDRASQLLSELGSAGVRSFNVPLFAALRAISAALANDCGSDGDVLEYASVRTFEQPWMGWVNAECERLWLLALLVSGRRAQAQRERRRVRPLPENVRDFDEAADALLANAHGDFDAAVARLKESGWGFGVAMLRIASERVYQREAEGADRLTPAELSIISDIADGLSNDAIATRRNVSVATVKCHIAHIFQKLGARSRTEAAAIARRRGILTESGLAVDRHAEDEAATKPA